MDFSGKLGTPVMPWKRYGTESRLGRIVWQLYCHNHGFGYVTRYAHLSKIDVKVGQK